jgi:hypothetical protein
VDLIKSIFRSLLFSCFFILLFGNLFGSYGVEIESVIPAYSNSFLIIRNFPDVWSAVRTSPSWQLLFSLDDIVIGIHGEDGIGEWWKRLLGPETEKLVLSAFAKQLALVSIGFNPSSKPALIIDTDNPTSASQIVSIIEQTLKRFGEYEIKSQAGTYMKVPFSMVKYKGEDNPLIYALIDNIFVLTAEQDTFETFVDVYRKQEPSIMGDPKFNRTLAEVSDESDLLAYMNMELMWLEEPERANTFLKILGVQDIKSIALSVDLLKPEGKQEMYIYIGEGQGILASVPVATYQMLSPHYIPASNADIFLTMNLGDPVEIWEIMNKSLEGITDIEKSEFEKGTGLNLKDDILASLTGEVGIAVPLPETIGFVDGSGSILEGGALIFFGIRDRERCAMALEKILTSVNVPFQQTQYKGVSFNNILPMSASEIPVGYIFAGDLLIFGNFQKLSGIVDEETPLVASEGFADLGSKFPQNVRAICYFDMKELTDITWKLTKKDVIENSTKLELSGQIAGAAERNEEGFKIQSVSTTGKSWLENLGYLLTLWNVKSMLNRSSGIQ